MGLAIFSDRDSERPRYPRLVHHDNGLAIDHAPAVIDQTIRLDDDPVDIGQEPDDSALVPLAARAGSPFVVALSAPLAGMWLRRQALDQILAGRCTGLLHGCRVHLQAGEVGLHDGRVAKARGKVCAVSRVGRESSLGTRSMPLDDPGRDGKRRGLLTIDGRLIDGLPCANGTHLGDLRLKVRGSFGTPTTICSDWARNVPTLHQSG